MPNHVCWLCEANTGHSIVGSPTFIDTRHAKSMPVVPPNDTTEIVCAAFACAVCKGMSVGLTTAPSGVRQNVKSHVADKPGDQFAWQPHAGKSRSYPDVPEHIADAAREAFECHSSGHYRAAILLARSVIEATAKASDVKTGNLQSKIDALAKKGLIRPLIKDAAHGVRVFGNEMAHGDFVQPVLAEESKQVIQLMGEILNEVFQQPARVEEMKQAVESRTAQPDS
jgi:hypothetical protein